MRVRLRLLPLPANDAMAAAVARPLDAECGGLTVRPFPDGESYVRIEGEVAGREVALVCTLDRPNERTLPLLLAAATARDLGARRVGLIAPYLAYMRQDRRFNPGEGVTSAYFARLLAPAFDWLVTVDPHLHRRASLAEVYPMPARALQAAPLVAAWLRAHVPDALVIGPDAESAQWADAIAAAAGAPSVVLQKVRHGDREVSVSLPPSASLRGRTPVLVDDIVSTGRTMLAAVGHLRALGTPPPVCIAVHAVCAEDALEALGAAGARVVTCNTILHPSNAIDVAPLVASGVRDALGG